jgi:uncharacterized ferritin-like protein (DUF455 family)
MEIRAFAEAVLFSADLELKLSAPIDLSDDRPGLAIDVPRVPGRPVGLALRTDKPIPAAPTPSGITGERARGLALHSFAHHELQALELMALALLRFPDAPGPFRRGLVKILTDEQRHFRMYRGRAEHYGVGMGDVGMGHFFWDTVAELQTPADFIAALCLTYEQANLDFSVYWADAFRSVDDSQSAAVLTEVYEDEITHVRHGITWFERLGRGCDFEDYARSLVFPLSPGRGKGPIFDREGRVRAGFSEHFIDEMEITNVSRGRPPRVFSFDPFVEERAAGRNPKAAVAAIQRDLEVVPMFLAHREDVVIARRPCLSRLRRLHRLGIEIPQFVDSVDDLADRLLGAAAPWGDEAQVGAVGKDVALGLRARLVAEHPCPLWADDASFVAHTLEDARPWLGQAWIAKAPLSASGQHRVRMDHPSAERWLEARLAEGPVVLEPWFKRLVDLSIQLDVREDGAHKLGVTRFWTSERGVFRGAVIGPWSAALPQPLLRALHGGSKRSVINDALTLMGDFIGDRLHARGHRGPAGVDAMVIAQGDDIRLLPVLEVNPRYTMGRVALEIHRSTGRRGGWFFLSDAHLAAAGFADREALIAAVEDDPMLAFCTEPTHVEKTLTLMSLGSTIDAARIRFEDLGFDWPESSPISR